MESNQITIPLANIMASAHLVPVSQRPTFLATLLVGSTNLDSLLKVAGSPSHEDEPWSHPLTVQQARELKAKLNSKTWDVLREAVENVIDGVGIAQWPKVKEITGVTTWTQFGKGRLGGLSRALRKIDGVPDDAVLLWEGDGWVEDGLGDYKAGILCIDGPAVRTLRSVMGISDAAA